MTNTAPIQEKEKRFHLIKEPDPYGKWSFIDKLFFSKKVVSLSTNGSADKVIVKKRSLGLIWFLLFVAIFVVCISLFITFPSNPNLSNLFYIIRQNVRALLQILYIWRILQLHVDYSNSRIRKHNCNGLRSNSYRMHNIHSIIHAILQECCKNTLDLCTY